MKKAGDLLHNYFDEIQMQEGKEYSELKNSWRDIAGDKIGYYSTLNDVVDGVLIIDIDHPGIKQLILLKERYIIRQINKLYPVLNISKIKFNFRNNPYSNRKKGNIQEETEEKTVEERVSDKDFLSLLKKMSKRSEE